MIQYATHSEFIAATSDVDLLAADKHMTGQPKEEEATRLSAQIERREISI